MRAAQAKTRPPTLYGDCWREFVTGDYRTDEDNGSQLAYLVLQDIQANRFAPLLGHVALDMIKGKCPNAFVVGFFQSIADVCLGHHQIPRVDVRLRPPVRKGERAA
jgi:hypothetical protein